MIDIGRRWVQKRLGCEQGPQQRETGTTVSTSTASWGGAPTKRNWDIMVFD
ncbi:hypothetical protein [Staphylococcus marylandisciuri]|uniref:hypothetical protein n=1 Tax=Staphylococcus marylandisciuri TaxID=2981529 RepID=UPI0021CEA348|nr:hypothetical protein [Staphylococcus marylandisciuri]